MTSRPTEHKRRSGTVRPVDAPTIEAPIARSIRILHWLRNGTLALLKWAKEIVWFEHSGHTPWTREPDRFVEVVVNKVLKETQTAR
jgi:hypothetical protein